MKNNSNKNKNKQDINNNLFNNIFKHISLRKNKTFYKDSYSEIKNKNDDIINYNEDINYENIYPINKSKIKIPKNLFVKKGKIIDNKEIKYFNSFLNQKLNKKKCWKIINVHKHNISFSYKPIENEQIKIPNNLVFLKKNNKLKNKSVLNNYNQNISKKNKLSKSLIIKEDSKLINEYTNKKILKNPIVNQIIYKNKKYPKIDLFQNYKNNLSLSIYNDNYINIKEKLYKNKIKNKSVSVNPNNYNFKHNLIQNLYLKYKKRNYSDCYLKAFNLKNNNTKINFIINIRSFEKYEDLIKNENQNKKSFINSISKDSFSQTEKKLNN